MRHRWGLIAAVLACALTACSSGSADDDSGGAGPTNDPTMPGTPGSEHAVATFAVVDEQFKIELMSPDLVEHAQRLLDGEDVSPIPIGRVVRGDSGVNAPWSWHIDPASVQFADAAIEVCDGIPSFVEDATITSEDYCPWSATVVALDPAS